ncbi:MAG: ABC transporter ATP-binding protein [Bacillota bacterium]
MGAGIRVKNLCKSYDKLEVIRNWSLTVKSSERIALLGPSGAGKTTFLKIAAGLEKQTSGEIVTDCKRIGFVFQEPRLIPWRSVAQNLKFIREDADIENILARLGLAGFASYYPNQLSGGMKQRVNLARALINEPDLLILDEAFSSLDLKVKLGIVDDVVKQWQEKGFTILAVTHDLKEALLLADRIVIISAAPSIIIHDLKIDLGQARDFSDPEFIKIESQLLKLMAGQ